MRIVTIILMVIAVTDCAIAELPLEEIWSIDFDRATALGNAWIDEDGNHNVLVGDGWQAKLVSNEEIIWTSDSLIGPITALIRVPYEDGEQFVVAASEPIHRDEISYGHLYRYSGNDFELISDQQLLGNDPDEYAGDIIDRRNIVKLAILPNMLGIEEHPVLASWEFIMVEHFEGDEFFDRTGYSGIIYDDSFSFLTNGFPVEMFVFQESRNNYLIAVGWSKDRTWWANERGFVGSDWCGVDLIDAQLRTVASESIAGYGWNNWLNRFPDREPELLGLTSVWSGNRSRLFVAYADSSFAFVSEVSVRGLNQVQRAEIPNNWRPGQMLSLPWEFEGEPTDVLLLINSQGSALMFDASNLEEIGRGLVSLRYVSSIVTDLDGDGNPNLLTLHRRGLIYFGFEPLAVPQDPINLKPTTLILSEPYPNPFNSQFKIEYQVPMEGHVTIRLYDLIGKQVAELVVERHPAGQYSITYHADDLATGVYIVRLSAGSENMIRKIVLLR